MAGEFEAARLAIHSKDGDAVGSLVATIEELARRIEVETAWIVPSCPLFADKRERLQRTEYRRFLLSVEDRL